MKEIRNEKEFEKPYGKEERKKQGKLNGTLPSFVVFKFLTS